MTKFTIPALYDIPNEQALVKGFPIHSNEAILGLFLPVDTISERMKHDMNDDHDIVELNKLTVEYEKSKKLLADKNVEIPALGKKKEKINLSDLITIYKELGELEYAYLSFIQKYKKPNKKNCIPDFIFVQYDRIRNSMLNVERMLDQECLSVQADLLLQARCEVERSQNRKNSLIRSQNKAQIESSREVESGLQNIQNSFNKLAETNKKLAGTNVITKDSKKIHHDIQKIIDEFNQNIKIYSVLKEKSPMHFFTVHHLITMLRRQILQISFMRNQYLNKDNNGGVNQSEDLLKKLEEIILEYRNLLKLALNILNKDDLDILIKSFNAQKKFSLSTIEAMYSLNINDFSSLSAPSQGDGLHTKIPHLKAKRLRGGATNPVVLIEAQNGEKFIVKLYPPEFGGGTLPKSDWDMLLSELSVRKQLGENAFENIGDIYGHLMYFTEESGSPQVIRARLSQYFPDKNIANLLEDTEEISHEEKLRIATRILQTWDSFSKNGVLFSDSKPTNWFLKRTSDGRVQSVHTPDDKNLLPVESHCDENGLIAPDKVGVTPGYVPSHLLKCKKYTPEEVRKLSHHALGVTLYELLTGRTDYTQSLVPKHKQPKDNIIEHATMKFDDEIFKTERGKLFPRLIHKLCSGEPGNAVDEFIHLTFHHSKAFSPCDVRPEVTEHPKLPEKAPVMQNRFFSPDPTRHTAGKGIAAAGGAVQVDAGATNASHQASNNIGKPTELFSPGPRRPVPAGEKVEPPFVGRRMAG